MIGWVIIADAAWRCQLTQWLLLALPALRQPMPLLLKISMLHQPAPAALIKIALLTYFLTLKTPNDASERVLSFHLKRDPLLNRLDRHGARPHQYRERDGYLSLLPASRLPYYLWL